jgi:DNA-binding NarL/FixJ family response regulator
MIRVLIADDYGPLRKVTRAILNRAEDIEVVGACGSPAQVVEFLETNVPPDVLLIEERFFTHYVIQALQKFPSVQTLVTSMHRDVEVINKVRKLDARGFLLKTQFDTQLILAIRALSQGQTYYPPGEASESSQ